MSFDYYLGLIRERKMLRLNRLLNKGCCTNWTRVSISSDQQAIYSFPSHNYTSLRFLNIWPFGKKAGNEKARARINDELSRGPFQDFFELKQHGGKVGMANKIMIPAVVAVKFPDFEVTHPDGKTLKLPIRENGSVSDANAVNPKASLLCLSFRGSSQAMIDSWSKPFNEAFHDARDIQLYQVSFIDSWLLCRYPIKKMLLWMVRKSNSDGSEALQKQMVYSFGDHYYFRKQLKLVNLATGYIFLLDRFGRIRWQGFGLASAEELSSLLSCTSLLLGEK